MNINIDEVSFLYKVTESHNQAQFIGKTELLHLKLDPYMTNIPGTVLVNVTAMIMIKYYNKVC